MIDDPEKCGVPGCKSRLEFAAEITLTVDVEVNGIDVRCVPSDNRVRLELTEEADEDDLISEAIRNADGTDSSIDEIYVRCVLRHHRQPRDRAALFAKVAALAGPDLAVGMTVFTDQNVTRHICDVQDRGLEGVEWVDEHGERWKARQVVEVRP